MKHKAYELSLLKVALVGTSKGTKWLVNFNFVSGYLKEELFNFGALNSKRKGNEVAKNFLCAEVSIEGLVFIVKYEPQISPHML